MSPFPLRFSFALVIALAQSLIPPMGDALSQVSREEIIDRMRWPATERTDQEGFPEASGGVSGRGKCIASADGDNLPPIIALVPPIISSEKYPYAGQTISSNPSLWFYIPYVIESTVTGQFKIQDENQEENLFVADFILPQQQPGFVQVIVSDEFGELSQLQYQEPYRWYFRLNCTVSETSNRPRTPELALGWITFTQSTPEIMAQLETAETIEETMDVYRSNNIWYDWAQVASTQGQESIAWEAVIRSRFQNTEYLYVMEDASILGSVTPIHQSN